MMKILLKKSINLSFIFSLKAVNAFQIFFSSFQKAKDDSTGICRKTNFFFFCILITVI